MRKLVSLVLTVCMCVSFGVLLFGCATGLGTGSGETGNRETEGKETFTGVSKAEWEQMLSESNFENYTVESLQRVRNSTDEEETEIKLTLKSTKDETLVSGDLGVLTGVLAMSQRSVLEQEIRTLLSNYEDFTYDSTEKLYKATSLGLEEESNALMTTTSVYDSVKVWLSEDGKLLKVEYEYTLTMGEAEDGAIYTYGVYTFSDYGTTVIPADEDVDTAS